MESFEERYARQMKEREEQEQQKPLNGIKDEVELEWNKYPMKID